LKPSAVDFTYLFISDFEYKKKEMFLICDMIIRLSKPILFV